MISRSWNCIVSWSLSISLILALIADNSVASLAVFLITDRRSRRSLVKRALKRMRIILAPPVVDRRAPQSTSKSNKLLRSILYPIKQELKSLVLNLDLEVEQYSNLM